MISERIRQSQKFYFRETKKNVVSQAGITPNIKDINPTPTIKINVLSIYSGKSLLIIHPEFADSVNRVDINDSIGQTNNTLTKNKNIFLNTLRNINLNLYLILKCYMQKLKISSN